ncbi:MAG: PAS domain-containing sensor histidine kinase [Spirochaetota bacterium]
MDDNGVLRLRIGQLEEELAEAYRLHFPWAGNLGRWEWHYPSGVVICSPLKLKALGFESGEINPTVHDWTARIHPEDFERTMDMMKRHLLGETPVYEVEYRIRAKDGSYKWFYDRGKVTEHSLEGKPLLIAGIVFDITESKQMEADLKKNVEFKTRLLAIISHDLRGPIGAAGTLLSMMGEMDPADYPTLVESLSQSNSKILNLLENLLEWSKINMERPRVDLQDVGLTDLVAGQLALLKPQTDRKRIEVKLALDDGLEVKADTVMLEVVIRNLLSNAIKFTPPGGLIEIGQTLEPGRADIHIRDSGRGLSPGDMQALRIMQSPFSQKGTEGEIGTGLGLQLCTDFLRLNHGELLIESEAGKGATFTVRLPTT